MRATQRSGYPPLYAPRTHAWLPRFAFDESFAKPSEGCDCKFEADQIPKEAAKGAEKGGIVGAVVGGAQGFVFGGPPGAAVGAAQGAAVGAGAGAGAGAITGSAQRPLAVSELTVHGYDIATGTGRPWPIPAEHAKLIVGTVSPEMSPLVLRPEAGRGAPVTCEVRLRGDVPRYVIRVAEGTAEVRAAGGPVDCVISADPVIFLLVSYGRMPLGQGGMLAWGRRPWLGLRFKTLFFNL